MARFSGESMLSNSFSEKAEKPDTILIPFTIFHDVREFVENIMNIYTWNRSISYWEARSDLSEAAKIIEFTLWNLPSVRHIPPQRWESSSSLDPLYSDLCWHVAVIFAFLKTGKLPHKTWQYIWRACWDVRHHFILQFVTNSGTPNTQLWPWGFVVHVNIQSMTTWSTSHVHLEMGNFIMILQVLAYKWSWAEMSPSPWKLGHVNKSSWRLLTCARQALCPEGTNED